MISFYPMPKPQFVVGVHGIITVIAPPIRIHSNGIKTVPWWVSPLHIAVNQCAISESRGKFPMNFLVISQNVKAKIIVSRFTVNLQFCPVMYMVVYLNTHYPFMKPLSVYMTSCDENQNKNKYDKIVWSFHLDKYCTQYQVKRWWVKLMPGLNLYF